MSGIFIAGQKRVFALDVRDIHVLTCHTKNVDARDKPGHDDLIEILKLCRL
jgi:hypothetical protein